MSTINERIQQQITSDTFNNWFEPGNLTAARRVLEATGHTIRIEGWLSRSFQTSTKPWPALGQRSSSRSMMA